MCGGSRAILIEFSHVPIFTGKKYTSEHEIVNFDDETGVGIIGITDHAQDVLGDVVFVELPTVGTQVKKGGRLFFYSSHAYTFMLSVTANIRSHWSR